MREKFGLSLLTYVALRKESVDRNPINVMSVSAVQVALRKESVDRNYYVCEFASAGRVALRKESVDRNLYLSSFALALALSLSARRAWIEIRKGFAIR